MNIPLIIKAKRQSGRRSYNWTIEEREKVDGVDQIYILGDSESNIKSHAIIMGLQWCKKQGLNNIEVVI